MSKMKDMLVALVAGLGVAGFGNSGVTTSLPLHVERVQAAAPEAGTVEAFRPTGFQMKKAASKPMGGPF